MSDAQHTTTLHVLDAYRADAQEREVHMRTLERTNRELLSANARYLQQLTRQQRRHTVAYLLGAALGYAANGYVIASTEQSQTAMVGYAVVLGGIVLITWGMRVFGDGGLA